MRASPDCRRTRAAAPERGRATPKKRSGRQRRPRAEILPARCLVRLDLHWLQVLVLEGRSAAFIERSLENACLPPVTSEELAAVRAQLSPPIDFNPEVPADERFLAYADSLGLGPVFRKAAEWRDALKILNSPRVREFVEAALICAIPPNSVSKFVRTCLHHTISRDAIRIYRAMFFDVSRVGRSQLKVLVGARVRLAVTQAMCGPEDNIAAAAALETDARNFAVTGPPHLLTWTTALMRLGFSPPKPRLAQLVDNVAELAAVRLGSLVLRAGDGDGETAERFAKILHRMSQVRAGIATPVEDLNASLSKFMLRTSTKPITTIADLLAQGDQVTVDFGPPATTAFDDQDGPEPARGPVEGELDVSDVGPDDLGQV